MPGFLQNASESRGRLIKDDVEAKRLPGAVLAIVHNGKLVAYDAIGYQERAAQTPMKKDSIFRVASMSKPITTVAAMILAEESKLDVGAPVAQYLPEFRSVKVGADGAAPTRPMTIQDLMRHTSGLTYGLFGNSPVDQMYRKANIFGAKSLAEMVKMVAGMPLLHQPGEAWEYSVSTDVLGRVVEVVSGMDLDKFVRTAHHRSAEDERHRILGEARGRFRVWPSPMLSPTCLSPMQRNGPTCFPVAAACSPPPATTRASRRCCLTAVRSTACAFFLRKPSR